MVAGEVWEGFAPFWSYFLWLLYGFKSGFKEFEEVQGEIAILRIEQNQLVK